MNNTTSGIVNIIPSTTQSPTITTTSSGTTINTSNLYGAGTTFAHSSMQGWSSSLNVGDFELCRDGDRLIIKDPSGRECLAIKNGTLMIGEQTIHELILDIVDMVNGIKPLTELLVDPDQSKRELGKQIYKRHRRLKRKRQRQHTAT